MELLVDMKRYTVCNQLVLVQSWRKTMYVLHGFIIVIIIQICTTRDAVSFSLNPVSHSPGCEQIFFTDPTVKSPIVLLQKI